MQRLLRLMGAAVERRPGRVLVALAALTVLLGTFASEQQTDTEMTAFAPRSDLAENLEVVQSTFSAGGASVQVVVDAGEGASVLTPRLLGFALELTEELRADEVISEALAHRDNSVTSFAEAALAGESEAATLTRLLSQDQAPDLSAARAGLIVFELEPTLPQGAVAEAEHRLAGIVRGAEPPAGARASALGQAIVAKSIQDDSEGEMGILLGLSLLLIVGILALQFRQASDVILGLGGLVAAITWMFGLGVLLGPDYLGVTGHFTQISIIVPVLLVGLGVDYTIHLTSRYREERRYGLNAGRSASAAVRTVGGALVLATAATTIGFLTNLGSPLPPLQDFGIFTALGVVSAFVVMSLFVPAARNWLDTRQARRKRSWRADPREVGPEVGGLARIMGRASLVARRAPRLTIAIALALTVAAGAAASQIGTSFSHEDFIPADSEVGELLSRVDVLFGGDIAETTFVLLEGEIAEPSALNAMAEASRRLAEVDGVRLSDGAAQLESPLTAITMLAEADPFPAERLAELGYLPGAALTAGTDVDAIFDLATELAPSLMSTVLAADRSTAVLAISTSAGQERAGELAAEISEAIQPLREAGLTAAVTSEPLVIDDVLHALTDSQTRGIAFTLVAALLLLAGYYGISERRPLLGVIAMIPSVAVVTWVLGTMWLLGYSFNVLTAMVASLGIGIGVPYGIHMTHRFLEDRRRYETIDEAVLQSVTHTGGAMAGSAATTAAGFGVLIFSSLVTIGQFGTIVAITIVYSLLAAVLVQPSCLKLWAEWRARRGDVAELTEADDHRILDPVG